MRYRVALRAQELGSKLAWFYHLALNIGMRRDIKCFAYFPVLLSDGTYALNSVYWIVELSSLWGIGPKTRLISDRDYTFYLLRVDS